VNMSIRKWLLIPLAILFVLASLPTLSFLLYQAAFAGRIYLGVKVLGLNLGGLTIPEAETLLRNEFINYKGCSIVISYGNRHWELSSGEVGATVDYRATAFMAYSIGRQGSWWKQLLCQGTALVRGVNLLPVVTFDRGRALSLLSRIAREVNTPAQDGGLSIRVDLSLEEVQPRDGVEVDVEATLRQVEELIASMQPGEVKLVVNTFPAAIVDTSKAKEQAEKLLKSRLILRFGGKMWAVEPAIIASWIKFSQVPAQDGHIALEVKLDEGGIEDFLQGIAAFIDREPLDARFDFDPATGSLTPIIYSRKGYKLKVEEAVSLVKQALLEDREYVDLPVEVLEPKVSVEKAYELGIRELVSKATTSFKGSSAARVKNIKRAAAQFHGLVIPPGEIFSFNRYLGKVTAANGYEDSLIIWGDRTRIGIGGGVCQVSTTAFRAAFWGGYEIIERHAHGYRVHWYEPPLGLDATVYAPMVDFKFRNDTPYYLLIETEVDEKKGTLTFYFYSTPTGRTVEMQGPFLSNHVSHGPPEYREDPTLPKGVVKQVEWAVDGVDVEVRRIVKEGDRVVHRDVFFSRYKPWNAVYLVGTREG